MIRWHVSVTGTWIQRRRPERGIVIGMEKMYADASCSVLLRVQP